MTVRELVERLSTLNPDDVAVIYDPRIDAHIEVAEIARRELWGSIRTGDGTRAFDGLKEGTATLCIEIA